MTEALLRAIDFGFNNFKGWMWEYRIVKGFSYWSGDFDPNPTPYVD